MNAETFISEIAPYAVEDMRHTGVLASITIAQAALESAWGKSAPGNNLFGIKGEGSTQTTQEYYENVGWVTVQDGFRVYESWLGSIADHSAFLTENGRYARAGFFDRCRERDYAGAARALQTAGYATDPNYATKLIGIIEQHELSVYDNVQEEAEPLALDKGVAQTIINTWMSPSWDKANDRGDKKQADYIHWLANELRKAAGIETT